jgi:hypothetical protein
MSDSAAVPDTGDNPQDTSPRPPPLHIDPNTENADTPIDSPSPSGAPAPAQRDDVPLPPPQPLPSSSPDASPRENVIPTPSPSTYAPRVSIVERPTAEYEVEMRDVPASKVSRQRPPPDTGEQRAVRYTNNVTQHMASSPSPRRESASASPAFASSYLATPSSPSINHINRDMNVSAANPHVFAVGNSGSGLQLASASVLDHLASREKAYRRRQLGGTASPSRRGAALSTTGRRSNGHTRSTALTNQTPSSSDDVMTCYVVEGGSMFSTESLTGSTSRFRRDILGRYRNSNVEYDYVYFAQRDPWVILAAVFLGALTLLYYEVGAQLTGSSRDISGFAAPLIVTFIFPPLVTYLYLCHSDSGCCRRRCDDDEEANGTGTPTGSDRRERNYLNPTSTGLQSGATAAPPTGEHASVDLDNLDEAPEPPATSPKFIIKAVGREGFMGTHVCFGLIPRLPPRYTGFVLEWFAVVYLITFLSIFLTPDAEYGSRLTLCRLKPAPVTDDPYTPSPFGITTYPIQPAPTEADTVLVFVPFAKLASMLLLPVFTLRRPPAFVLLLAILIKLIVDSCTNEVYTSLPGRELAAHWLVALPAFISAFLIFVVRDIEERRHFESRCSVVARATQAELLGSVIEGVILATQPPISTLRSLKAAEAVTPDAATPQARPPTSGTADVPSVLVFPRAVMLCVDVSGVSTLFVHRVSEYAQPVADERDSRRRHIATEVFIGRVAMLATAFDFLLVGMNGVRVFLVAGPLLPTNDNAPPTEKETRDQKAAAVRACALAREIARDFAAILAAVAETDDMERRGDASAESTLVTDAFRSWAAAKMNVRVGVAAGYLEIARPDGFPSTHLGGPVVTAAHTALSKGTPGSIVLTSDARDVIEDCFTMSQIGSNNHYLLGMQQQSLPAWIQIPDTRTLLPSLWNADTLLTSTQVPTMAASRSRRWLAELPYQPNSAKSSIGLSGVLSASITPTTKWCGFAFADPTVEEEFTTAFAVNRGTTRYVGPIVSSVCVVMFLAASIVYGSTNIISIAFAIGTFAITVIIALFCKWGAITTFRLGVIYIALHVPIAFCAFTAVYSTTETNPFRLRYSDATAVITMTALFSLPANVPFVVPMIISGLNLLIFVFIVRVRFIPSMLVAVVVGTMLSRALIVLGLRYATRKRFGAWEAARTMKDRWEESKRDAQRRLERIIPSVAANALVRAPTERPRTVFRDVSVLALIFETPFSEGLIPFGQPDMRMPDDFDGTVFDVSGSELDENDAQTHRSRTSRRSVLTQNSQRSLTQMSWTSVLKRHNHLSPANRSLVAPDANNNARDPSLEGASGKFEMPRASGTLESILDTIANAPDTVEGDLFSQHVGDTWLLISHLRDATAEVDAEFSDENESSNGEEVRGRQPQKPPRSIRDREVAMLVLATAILKSASLLRWSAGISHGPVTGGLVGGQSQQAYVFAGDTLSRAIDLARSATMNTCRTTLTVFRLKDDE